MSQIFAKIVLLGAACLGTLPADHCLFMLAGGCCDESHVIKSECHLHADHASDEAVCSELNAHSSHHHETCVVVSSEALTLQAPHVPTVDLHHSIAPLDRILACIECAQLCARAADRTDTRGGLRPPDPQLFLLTHSFLI